MCLQHRATSRLLHCDMTGGEHEEENLWHGSADEPFNWEISAKISFRRKPRSVVVACLRRYRRQHDGLKISALQPSSHAENEGTSEGAHIFFAQK